MTELVHREDARSLEPWQQAQLASCRRWLCVCAGEERAEGWRHSLACPVRGPGWTLPPRYEPYGLLPEPDLEEAARARPALSILEREQRLEEARALRAQGLSYKEIGKKFGVTAPTVHHWLNR